VLAESGGERVDSRLPLGRGAGRHEVRPFGSSSQRRRRWRLLFW
jgi:hypothetical protein